MNSPVIREKIAQVKRWIEVMQAQIKRAQDAGRRPNLEQLALNSAERILRDIKQADTSLREARELLTRTYIAETPRALLTGEGLQDYLYEWDLYCDRGDAVELIKKALGPSDRGTVLLCNEPKSGAKSEGTTSEGKPESKPVSKPEPSDVKLN